MTDATSPTGSRQAKDGVFRALFKIKRYLLELYLALHPEDTGVTEDDLHDITLENVIAVKEYNDLGFIVRDRLMILAEAQSTWSDNTLVRMMIYTLHEYYDYITRNTLNLFSTKKLRLPRPELYIIYTGERASRPERLSLRELFWGGEESSLELTARVIYGGRGDDIIGQYITFAKIFTDEAARSRDDLRAAAERTIKRCKSEGVLVDFLSEHEREVYDAVQLFTAEFIREAIRLEAYNEGKLDTLFDLVRDGHLSADVASAQADISVADFNAQMAEHFR